MLQRRKVQSEFLSVVLTAPNALIAPTEPTELTKPTTTNYNILEEIDNGQTDSGDNNNQTDNQTDNSDNSGQIDNEFKNLKDRLDIVRSKLDMFNDKSYAWVRLQVDLYRDLRFIIEKKYNEKNVTNAWSKYWEIYSYFDIKSYFDTEIKIFCNAELPGSSICAWHHYATQHGLKYDWRASSFSPYTEEGDKGKALGDKFGLWKHNKSNWMMDVEGEENSNNGDATQIANLLDLEAKIGPKSTFGGCHIYSHDAGLDVTSDYNEQELMNAKLHLGCAIAGFLTMRKGAMFIAKQYTFLAPFTRSLFPLYADMFEKFLICKPMTSRPSNSETYLVGIGFKGFIHRGVLINRLKHFDTSPVEIIPKSMGTKLLQFATVLAEQQMDQVNEIVDIYIAYKQEADKQPKKYKEDKILFAKQKEDVINEWLGMYPIEQIKNYLASN